MTRDGEIVPENKVKQLERIKAEKRNTLDSILNDLIENKYLNADEVKKWKRSVREEYDVKKELLERAKETYDYKTSNDSKSHILRIGKEKYLNGNSLTPKPALNKGQHLISM